MKTTCLCNLCSNQIEFESNATGQAIACPHCGMETVLYRQSNRVTPVTNAQSQAEQPIYSRGNILVTGTRLIIGSTTYAIASISSFRRVAISPNKSPLHWVSTFAAFFFFMGSVLVFSSEARMESIILLPLGAILAVCALIVRKRLKPSFAIRIATTAGEQQVLTSLDLDSLHPIESALHEAISLRG